MLQFDANGLLTPATAIPSSIEELQHEFSVKLNGGRRKELFDLYVKYCTDLKSLCGDVQLVQWVDGSYTTHRKNPFDIDLVTFIDFDIVKAKENELKNFVFPKSLENYQMDAYVIITYPANHRLYPISHSDRLYWVNHFSKTKPNRYRKRLSKGFLEINV